MIMPGMSAGASLGTSMAICDYKWEIAVVGAVVYPTNPPLLFSPGIVIIGSVWLE